MLRRLATALLGSAAELAGHQHRSRCLAGAAAQLSGMCGVDVSTSAMQNVSPNLQLRRLSSVPEFTAETAGGPQFTADPGRSTAGMGATDTTTSSTSGKEEAGGWAGGIDDALVQVQEAALSHVKELGWSNEALVAGARDVDVSPAIAGSLQKGGADLVQFFVRRCQAALAERVAAEQASLAELPLQQRLHTLLRWRLEMLKPYVDSWPQALAALGSPSAAASSLGLLNDLADEVWHAAGDRSMDLSWYTKRAGLAGIYSATEIYMLTGAEADYSADYGDTWSYLDRRIADMLTLGISV